MFGTPRTPLHDGNDGGGGPSAEEIVKNVLAGLRNEDDAKRRQAAEEQARRDEEQRLEAERKARESVNFNELFSEGKADDAVKILKSDLIKDAASLVTPLYGAAAESARNVVRAEIGEVAFNKYYPQAVELLKREGIELDQAFKPDQIKRAIAYARSLNLDGELDEIRKQEREKVMQEISSGYVPHIGAGSIGEVSRQENVKFDPNEVEIIKSIGFDPTTFAKHKKTLERFASPDGSISGAPVLDEDIPFSVDRIERMIEPGKF